MTGSPDQRAARESWVGRALGGSPDAAPTPVRTLGADTRPKVGPKVGDEVELVVRGRIHAAGPGQAHMGYWFKGSKSALDFWLDCPDVVSVEVLTPPAPTEPDWWPPMPGDTLRFYESTYLRDENNAAGKGWRNTFGAWMDDDYLLRHHRDAEHADCDVTLLVRAGKAVTP